MLAPAGSSERKIAVTPKPKTFAEAADCLARLDADEVQSKLPSTTAVLSRRIFTLRFSSSLLGSGARFLKGHSANREHEAAICRDHTSSHKGRQVTGEECDDLRDLLGFSHAANRMYLMAGSNHAFGVVVERNGPAQHGGIDGSGTDGVDSYVVFRIIKSHGAREPDQRVLAHNVGERVTLSAERLDRGGNHDGSAAALDHVWNRVFRNQKAALQISGERVIPLGFRGGGRAAVGLNAGVADQDVNAAKRFHNFGYELLDVGAAAEIRIKESQAIRCCFAREFLTGVVVAVEYSYVGVTIQEFKTGGASNARRAAGNNHHLPGKIHGRLLAATENVPVRGVSREDPPT